MIIFMIMKKERFRLILWLGFILIVFAYFIRLKQAVNDSNEKYFSKEKTMQKVLE